MTVRCQIRMSLFLALFLLLGCESKSVTKVADAGDVSADTGPDAVDIGSDAGDTGPDAADIGSDAGDTGPDAADIGSDAGDTGPDAADIGSDAGDTGPDAEDIGSDVGDTGPDAEDATATTDAGPDAEDATATTDAGPDAEDATATTDADADATPECTADAQCAGLNLACTVGKCVSGACVATASPDATACEDGSVCTTGDACTGGVCLPGAATSCDDANPCTTDSCDKTAGCQHSDNVAACDDKNACTTTDMCMLGVCVGMGAKVCSDANACTTDSCDPVQACTFAAAATNCDDGNACTTSDNCVGTVCTAGTALGCDDSNACTVDSCVPATGCAHANANDGTVCDDGNAQTSGDACKTGLCVGSLPGSPTPTCEDYCTKVQAACTGSVAQYASNQDCLDYCKTLGKFPAGTATDAGGDTIGCRTNQAGQAKDVTSAGIHCPSAGKSGGGVCGTLCENLCQVAGANCATTFSSASDCASKCAGASATGPVDATSGATVQCYLHYAALAGTNAAMCSGVAIPNASGGQCVDAAQGKTWTVNTPNFTFDPADLTIAVGDTVKFELQGFHTASNVDKTAWDANQFVMPAGGQEFNIEFTSGSHLFSKAGDFYYVCKPHVGGGMKGKITVK
jgi:plastocyanin